jgi:hypothetical protein
MHPTSAQIREIISSARPRLLELSTERVCCKDSPDSWSKQEILGHLIDSTLNNHQRVVRGALNQAENFPPYQQDRWVAVQAYNEANWGELVEFWAQSNLHLCWAIDHLPDKAVHNPVNIGKDAPVTLDFVIRDYLRHLNLHLAQIFE